MSAAIEAEWNRVLQAQQHRLRKKKYNQLVQQLTYQSFSAYLSDTIKKYSNKKIVKGFSILQRTLEKLNDFTQPITSMVQAGLGIAGFIWGSLQAVIVISSKFTKTLETVLWMIEELTSTITRVNKYLDLFPQSTELRDCMRDLVQAFVSFCITVIKYCHKWPIYNLCRAFWGTIDKELIKTKAEIAGYIRTFEAGRQYAADSTLRRIEDATLPVRPSFVQPEKIYVVPYAQSARFCGRVDVLESIAQSVSQNGNASNTVQLTIAIHGVGGMGKTQVAIEYTYRCRQRGIFDYIFWLRADRETELAEGMAALVGEDKLNLPPVQQGAGQNREVEAVRTFLENTSKRWLLVFDNAESWATVDMFRPRCSHGVILITTQHAQLAQQAHNEIALKPLQDDEGVQLLLAHLAGGPFIGEEEIPKSICRELGYLPIAIAHVAGYIGTKASMTRFLKLFRERVNSSVIFEVDSLPSTSQYGKRLAIVWDLALDELTPKSLLLLQIMSMLSPSGVSDSVLCRDHTEPELQLLTPSNRLTFDGFITELTDRHLIDQEVIQNQETFITHRSLQRSVLHRLDKDFGRFQDIFRIASSLIRNVLPRQHEGQVPQNELWYIFAQYKSHIMSLREVFLGSATRPSGTIEFAETLCDTANYCWEKNILSDGVLLNSLAETISDSIDGEYNRRANIYAIGAAIRQHSGISQRQICLKLFRTALQLRQQYINETNRNSIIDMDCFLYSNAWNDIGCVLLDSGCYSESVPYFELAITVKEKIGTDIVYLESEKNNCIALAGQGKYDQAISELQQITAIMEREMDPNGGTVQEFRYHLACILLSANRLNDAFTMIELVIKHRTNLFTPNGRATLDAYFIKAVIEQMKGDLSAARNSLEHALAKPEEWSEADIGRASSRLASVLVAMGQGIEAQKTSQQASEILTRLVDTYQPTQLLQSQDSMLQWDHMVSVEAGRTTLGAFDEESLDSDADKRCTLLLNKMKAISGSISVQKMVDIIRESN